MDQPTLRKIYSEIDKRSYDLMKSAEQFVDRHNLPTASQASGLMGTANGENNLNTLLTKYIQHQATKSTARDSEFWQDLRREIDGLRKPAEEIHAGLALVSDSDKARKERLQQIQLLLARDYIQHLAIHAIYRKATREDDHDSLA